jgi:hypothetical protein
MNPAITPYLAKRFAINDAPDKVDNTSSARDFRSRKVLGIRDDFSLISLIYVRLLFSFFTALVSACVRNRTRKNALPLIISKSALLKLTSAVASGHSNQDQQRPHSTQGYHYVSK